MRIILSAFFWLVTALATILAFLSIVAITIFLFPFDRKRKLRHAQGFWWADVIIGVNPFWSLSIAGLEHIDYHKTYVVVVNHQSLADIIMLYKTGLQFKWVAKENLFKIPFLGWAMSLVKYIPIRRGEFSSIKDTYLQAAYWLGQEVSVLFFPEGTRSTTGQIGDFKNGAFKLAIKEKKPVLPIRIEGSNRIIRRGSWILQPRACFKITVLPQISTDTFEAKDFALLRDKVRTCLVNV